MGESSRLGNGTRYQADIVYRLADHRVYKMMMTWSADASPGFPGKGRS
jgi:hypothetical protein